MNLPIKSYVNYTTCSHNKNHQIENLSNHQMKTYALYIGLFQKKYCTPCWRYQFFWSWPPGFPVNFIMTPWTVQLFALTSLEVLVFIQILTFPLKFQLLSLYPLEISIDILNRGYFFRKSPFDLGIRRKPVCAFITSCHL